MTSRWLLAALVFASTAAAGTRMFDVLRTDGLTTSEGLFLALVTILFCWIATAFWLSVSGGIALWRRTGDPSLRLPPIADPRLRKSASRTALLFPIRNEDGARLYAGLNAMIGSLHTHGVLDRFDVVLLSDSQGRENLEAEQAGYVQLRSRWSGAANVYYRHRTSNEGRKSGNLSQFCRNWGGLYDYMVVLDADSIMTAGTLVELVRLMDENPSAGLIQSAPQLVGRESLFARIQQFASSVYGPLYAAGYSTVLAGDGNYWGHNAIIRVHAFAESCGLPVLSGHAPFGGEIMSHDFVEAALLRRAGWEVHMASHLSGSYEEPPPDIIEYLKRDRRWCQGNLQHLRILFAQGLRPTSRWHLGMGIMSYLASPLWLLLLAVSAVVALQQTPFVPFSFIGPHPVLAWPVSHTVALLALFSAMAALLFIPKLFATALVLRTEKLRRAHGGAIKVVASVLVESLFSILLAPIMMLSQSGFVLSIVMGRAAGWNTQKRSEGGGGWARLLRSFLLHTIIGVVAAFFVWKYLPQSGWWVAPLIIGPVLSIPLAGLAESVGLGLAARRFGLFISPWESGEAPLVEEVRRATRVAELAKAVTA